MKLATIEKSKLGAVEDNAINALWAATDHLAFLVQQRRAAHGAMLVGMGFGVSGRRAFRGRE
jgi:hypothetical protein